MAIHINIEAYFSLKLHTLSVCKLTVDLGDSSLLAAFSESRVPVKSKNVWHRSVVKTEIGEKVDIIIPKTKGERIEIHNVISIKTLKYQ